MAADSPPPEKKQKTEDGDAKDASDWKDHKMNCAEALMKADEGRHLADLADESVLALQGVGPLATRILEVLGIKSVRDLATYKYFLLARALKTLSETESDGKRPSGSVMNVDKAVVKKYETMTLREIVDSPLDALEGMTKESGDLLKELGVKTVGDLGELKYCRWAEAIVELGQHEHTKTAAERKQETMLKKLS